jgi:hypothetical protein
MPKWMKRDDKLYYIYALVDPRNHQTRYIGPHPKSTASCGALLTMSCMKARLDGANTSASTCSLRAALAVS